MAVPKLRFKEFDADWEKTTLGEVVKFSNGKRVPLSETDRQKRQGKYRYYGASGVIDYVDDYLFDGQYILIGEDGANIITRSSTLAFVVEGQFWVNNHAHIFQSKHGDNVFLATYLESLNYERFNSGTAQPKLNLENLKKVPVANPQKPEQTKIASFLSTVDEKISQLTQKHALLSQYKQGIMQKLFSQQIRFKADDGSEFGEWEELKFKDVIKIKYGKDHKKLDDGDIPVLGTGGIMRYVDSYLYEGESILIGRKGTIDKPRFISGKFWTVDTLFYTEIGEKILPKFAFQQLLLVNWLNLNEATGVPSLNTTSIGNIELKVPCLAEQTKIANFLSAIDQKIEVVAQQIEQAKQWKKGLLQQMFV
ncbi:restriction endonuclease subunit S [Acinetobacter sp. AL9]|uniref:restriction endonuclease subunit S n=1 Tax=Acinetobacter sp. AL9 TaxID=3273234 RepID=UPI003558EE5F